MEQAAVEEVRPRHPRDAGGVLPLALGGEASPLPLSPLPRLPARVGVRLVEADVADRLLGVDVAHPGEGPQPPAAALFLFPLFLPIQRRRPSLLLDLGPAVRQPEEGIAIAAVRH